MGMSETGEGARETEKSDEVCETRTEPLFSTR